MDQSISILGLSGGFFQFYSNFNRIFCKQTRRPDKTARSVASDLGLHCFIRPTKSTLGIYGLMIEIFHPQHFIEVNPYNIFK